MSKRTLILAVTVLIAGVALTWYGATTLFADGVTTDVNGTAGGLALLPLTAAILGTAAIVWALCAVAWQIGKLRQHARVVRSPHADG